MSRLGAWLGRLFVTKPALPAAAPLFLNAPGYPKKWPMPTEVASPEQLSGELAELLRGTVGPDGLPGVLADWIDERRTDWAPLTAALRVATPVDQAEPGQWVAPPRYLVLAEEVVVWLTQMRVPNDFNQPGHAWLRLGFHRTTPGREAAYRLDVKAELSAAGRVELSRLFGEME